MHLEIKNETVSLNNLINLPIATLPLSRTVDIDFQKIHFARQQGGIGLFLPFPTDNAAKLF